MGKKGLYNCTAGQLTGFFLLLLFVYSVFLFDYLPLQCIVILPQSTFSTICSDTGSWCIKLTTECKSVTPLGVFLCCVGTLESCSLNSCH